jgi:mono/diheme cytochrome c family protein
MKRYVALLLFLSVAVWQTAAAQTLTAEQRHGRQLLTQNCSVCHLPQDPGAATFGPRLDRNSANGDDALMKQVIETGLVQMPGWQYQLSESDIDAIISYVRTIPVVAAPASR